MIWMPDGKILWNYIKHYNPIILSSPARTKECKEGKVEWIKRELQPVPQYIIDPQKQKYARQNAILIDDTKDNLVKWEAAGGIGVLHRSAQGSIQQLKIIMGNNEKI